jgi:2,5-dihydroxypyridine 5,6-dioxygenase
MKLLTAWKELLQLCKVAPGDTVVFLLAGHSHPNHIAASQAAAALLGATIASITLGESVRATRTAGVYSHGTSNLTGNRPAIEAMKNAEMVVDLMGIDRGTEQKEILDAGTRILLVKEPPDIFMRLLPTQDDKRRALAAQARLQSARTMRVTSAAGTDFALLLGDFRLMMQYGFVDEPGRWDHAPSTFVGSWPNEHSANGTLVLDSGTTLLPLKEYVRTPIRLTVQDGYIKAIDGEFDADYLRDYMAKFDDPEAYAISHVGWGLQRKAHWTGLGLYDKQQSNAQEARSFEGNFMFSTGENLEGGGHRRSACHLDIPMRGCSLMLDEQPVMIDQKLVGEFA